MKKKIDLLIYIHRLFGKMMSTEMEQEFLEFIDWFRSQKC